MATTITTTLTVIIVVGVDTIGWGLSSMRVFSLRGCTTSGKKSHLDIVIAFGIPTGLLTKEELTHFNGGLLWKQWENVLSTLNLGLRSQIS
jgi:hypothetical protein